jgi:hypothetical protein
MMVLRTGDKCELILIFKEVWPSVFPSGSQATFVASGSGSLQI